MAKSQSLTIDYELRLPTEAAAPDLVPSKSHKFSLQGSDVDQGYKAFYQSLRAAIAEARDVVGGELTAWRDAVGSSENQKETKRRKSDDEDEDEDIEGESDDQP